MQSRLIVTFVSIFILSFSGIYGQTCQDDGDADIGLDRKDWEVPGGSTTLHSEGYALNFELPEEEECKKIQNVEISISVSGVDVSGLDPACGSIQYFINIYSGCGSTLPASCDPDLYLVAEPNNGSFFCSNIEL